MRLALSFSRGEVAALLAESESQTGATARRAFALNASPARQWFDGVEIGRELLLRAGLGQEALQSAVVAFDAPISLLGIVENDVRARGWAGYDLPRGLREHFGVSAAFAVTRVEAEARYEREFGVLKEAPHWFYLRLGTRIESLASWNGNFVPAQLSALFVEKDGILDEFSRRGTLGAYCSGEGFNARATSYGITLTAPAQVWALAPTNFAAQSLVEDFTARLAIGICGILAMFGPLPIVVGGEFGREIWPFLRAPLETRLREIAPPHSEGFSLQLALGESDAPLWGALNAARFAAQP